MSNELPTLKGKWHFSFKIFRNNIYSIDPTASEDSESSKDSKFLHILKPSYLQGSTVAVVNKKSVGIFSDSIAEEVKGNPSVRFPIPDYHLHRGATTGLNDPFDYFTSQKLQSLWTQKQNIRGDSGEIYELENGNLTIRTSNVSLHGNFRGLLIQLELSDNTIESGGQKHVRDILDEVIQKYGIPQGELCYDVLDSRSFDKYGDLCLQYAQILNF